MKQLTTIIAAILMTIGAVAAQQTETKSEETIIHLSSDGSNTISANNGKLSIMLNGAQFEIGSNAIKTETGQASLESKMELNNIDNDKRVYVAWLGIGAPRFNHFAAMEYGVSPLVNTSYSIYTPEEAIALMFNNNKSFNANFNLITLNVALMKSRALALSMAFGFAYEDYVFADKYTMKYDQGVMRPVHLDGDRITKSKLSVSYIHIPITLDWNIKQNFFISAGLNFDILMGCQTVFKKPRTSIKNDTITLNPIQLGATARMGWKRLYLYANYSFLQMFKKGTGPEANRMSMGVGIWF